LSASPDGELIAATVAGPIPSLVVMSGSGSGERSLTEIQGVGTPLWVRGPRLIVGGERRGVRGLHLLNPSGAEPARCVLASEDPMLPGSLHPDGETIAYSRRIDGVRWQIGVSRMFADGEPPVVWASRSDQLHPRFSPDGTAIAYQSNESGRFEIYIRPYPEIASPRRISTGGGVSPVWSKDGTALFYANGEGLMSVATQTGPTPRFGTPLVLIRGNFMPQAAQGRGFDVAPDGSRFLLLRSTETNSRTQAGYLHVVFNWFETLRHQPGGTSHRS
jgi:serine/threonine-protein kinase